MTDAVKAPPRVLALVAHPDDEVLGVGGTLARHAAQGQNVYIAFLADGVGARSGDKAAAERRAAASRQAAKILGAHPPRFLGFEDQRLDAVELLDIVRKVEALIEEIQPVIVYTHHHGDLNLDHVICQRAVMTACRPLPGSPVRRIYAMEVASSTEWAPGEVFNPTRFVDVSSMMDIKRRALEAYAEEMRPFPHARSFDALDALARWRGSSVGLTAAEAFAVLREIES
jgi:LmbE family N-acetylglucosaminyl deacetylase